jgi:branched-chain amino acid transport system ATP-binding protein
MMPKATVLEIDGLESGYGGSLVLRGLSFAVAEGESVALLGRNGMGKTTLLRAIMGLLPARRGEVRFAGQRLDGRRPEQIAKAGIAFVPQGREIFADLSVEENLLLGAMGRAGLGAAVPEEIYGRFPILKERRRQRGGTLSGGQQQQLAIGRALAGRPRLLLLDEPSLGLAPAIVLEMFRVIRGINARGVAVLLVEQNVAAALEIARCAYVLEEGRIAAQGEPRELAAQPHIQRAYLGLHP